MNRHMPRTPFSTPLSGSAKETELRLRNIFSGPKKRPPALFLVLIALLILLCGNLVAFRTWPAAPTIVMETQYYDSYANYLEIPMLALPAGEKNEAVEAINDALNDLRRQYSVSLNSSEPLWEEQCLFYPSTTSRYLNLLFYRDTFTTDLNTGHVFSLVYDLREGTLVPAKDALALAGLNEKGLLDQVTEQIQVQLDRDSQEYGFQLALHNLTLEGFRIKADGQPVFYLTGRTDDVDDTVNDAVSGADQLYIWEDRTVTVYDQYSPEPVPLVPAEETDKLDPPLWCQWFFAGEEPEGGFVDKSLLEPEYVYVPGEDPYGNNFFEVLMDCYAAYQEEWNVFYAEYASGQEEDGDLRIGPAVYLGEIPWGEDAYAAVYDVYYTFYHNTLYAGSVWGFDWDVNREMLVLSRSAEDGSFTGLLGRADYNYQMEDMTAEALIRQIMAG